MSGERTSKHRCDLPFLIYCGDFHLFHSFLLHGPQSNGNVVNIDLVSVDDEVMWYLFHLHNYLNIKQDLFLHSFKVVSVNFGLRTGSPFHKSHALKEMLAPALRQGNVSSISCKEIAILVPDDAFSIPNGNGCVYHCSIRTKGFQLGSNLHFQFLSE